MRSLVTYSWFLFLLTLFFLFSNHTAFAKKNSKACNETTRLIKAIDNDEHNYLADCIRKRRFKKYKRLLPEERKELLKVALARNDKISSSMLLGVAPFGISPHDPLSRMAHEYAQNKGYEAILKMLNDNYLLYIISKNCNYKKKSCTPLSFEEYSTKAAKYGYPSEKHLHRAIAYKKGKIVDFLLSKKLDINFKKRLDYFYRDKWRPSSADFNYQGESLLHLAIRHKNNPLAERLIEMGANLNSSNAYGETPSHYAANNGSLESLELLARHGADLAKASRYWPKQQNTPLDYAVRRGHLNIVNYLIKHTKPHSAKTTHPVIVASEKGFPQITEILLSTQHVPFDQKVLQDALLKTIVSRKKTYQKTVELLFKHGVSIKGIENKVFELAIQTKKNDLLTILKDQGGDVFYVDGNGTYFHKSARYGNLEALMFFKSMGVNPELKNKDGNTAYDVALLNSHKSAADYISGKSSELIDPGTTGYISGNATNLRKAPTTKSDIMMQLPFGTSFKVQSGSASWMKVCLESNQEICGYLHKSVVSQKLEDAKKPILIEDLKKRFHKYRSIAGAEVDGQEFNLGMTGADSSYLKGMQERFEQLSFFHPELVLLKQRLRALFVLNRRLDRFSKYKNTPVKVMQNSRQYGVIPVSAYSYEYKETLRRLVDLPDAKTSFLTQQNQLFFATATGRGKVIHEFVIVPHALVAHLLRLYFPASNDLQLQKNRKTSRYYYQSKSRIPFFSLKNGQLIKHTAKLQFADDVQLVECDPVLNGPLDLLFANKTTMNRMEQLPKAVEIKHVKHNYTKSGQDSDDYLSGYKADTTTIDLDNDNTIDLLVSFEACPQEAGDSNDIVNAINVEGQWVRQLISRKWCYP